MTERHPTNFAASVRQRLLNLARERGDEFQLILMRYGVERLLYRLGQSPHADAFVLKGAVLFQMWTGQPHRSTLDVDFLATGTENAVAPYESIVRAICDQPVEPDGIVFDPATVRGEAIREEQRYHGVRIHLAAMLGTARVPVQIDIGFWDAITPGADRVVYPSLIGLPTATLSAYPPRDRRGREVRGDGVAGHHQQPDERLLRPLGAGRQLRVPRSGACPCRQGDV